MTNFLAHIKTKAELIVYLAKKLMEYYEHNEKIVIVTYDTTIACNRPLTDVVAIFPMCEGKHSLEEADHQIVLHSIDIAEKNHNIVLDDCLFTGRGCFGIADCIILPQNTILNHCAPSK
jgi:hypothetical protein